MVRAATNSALASTWLPETPEAGGTALLEVLMQNPKIHNGKVYQG